MSKSLSRSKVLRGFIGTGVVLSLISFGLLSSPGFSIFGRAQGSGESNEPVPLIRKPGTEANLPSPSHARVTSRVSNDPEPFLSWQGIRESRNGLLAAGSDTIGAAVGSGDAHQEEGDQRGDFEEQVERVRGVQDRYTDYLLSLSGVVGTAVGLTQDGEPAVQVYTKQAGMAGVPTSLEGIPVIAEASGEFFAIRRDTDDFQSMASVNPASRFDRPVPIGTSTGNQGECSAGTIAARVKDAATLNVFALSNNHVYALENSAPLGSKVLQPGLYDTSCVPDLTNNVIGTLSAFVPINFNCTCSFFSCTCDASKDNVIDAAIASSSTSNLDNATPSNGYGIPRSTTAGVNPGQKVQKYGRTTSLTRGSVNGTSATVIVNYGGGKYARFTGQFTVKAKSGPFLKAGDSGSLVVTDPGASPVGLLFAGNSSGSTGIANPIGAVLKEFGGLTIDGQSGP